MMPNGVRIQWPPELLDYLVECYAGTEPCGGPVPQYRRMYLWESQGEVRFGNVEAWVEHVLDKFALNVLPRSVAGWANRTLLEMGESVRIGGTHIVTDHPQVSHRPTPEYRVIRHVE